MDLENIVIDISQKNHITIPSVQYDSNIRFATIKIVNNSKKVDVTNYRIAIACKKPDGKIILNDCEKIESKIGLVRVEVTEQIGSVAGTVECELRIYGEGNACLTTQPFNIEVTEPILDATTVVSSNEFRALTKAMSDIVEIDNKVATLDKKVDTEVGKINTQVSKLTGNKIFVDDYATVKEAFDYALIHGGVLVFSNKEYTVNETLTVDLSKIRIEGNYCTLNSTSGSDNLIVLRIISTASAPYFQNANYIKNMHMVGKGITSSQVAIHFNGDNPSHSTSHLDMVGLNIHDFGVGIKYDSFTYLIRHYSCDIFACDVCVSMEKGGADYGENINFYACAFYNSNTCIKGSNPDGAFHFNSCSADYSKTYFDITNNNKCFFENGHIEGSGNIKGSVNISNSWLVLLWKDGGHFDVSDKGYISIKDCFVNTNAINREICVGDGRVRFENIRHFDISDLVTNKLNDSSSVNDIKYMNIYATNGTSANTTAWNRGNCNITFDQNQFFYTVNKEYGQGSNCAVSILIPKSKDSSRVHIAFKARSENGALESKVYYVLNEAVLQHSNDHVFKTLYANKLAEATIQRIETTHPSEHSVYLNVKESSPQATHYVLELNLFNCPENTKLHIQHLRVFEY